MANVNPVVRNGRSVLIGASAAQFTDQMAVDLYFDNYWTAQGPLMRVTVVCVGWGMSIAFVQRANHRDGPWQFVDALLPRITVQDHGIQPFNPPSRLPNNPVGPPLGPWHHRVELRRAPPGNEPLHYNQHLPRKDHRAQPPAIKPGGSHRVFSTITYGTQIQNFRRIRELPRANQGQGAA